MCLFLDLEFKHDQDLMADAADAITNGFAAVLGCTQHRGEPHPSSKVSGRSVQLLNEACATFTSNRGLKREY